MKSSQIITIKPVEEAHLPLLQEWFPEGGPAKHAERLERQKRGNVIYLFAWVDDHPVGHLLLKWQGIGDEQVRQVGPLVQGGEDLVEQA